MGYNYIPKYIRQSENKSPKSVVTASRWNELFNLLIQQGDHTAEELGKILDYLSTGLEDLTSEKLDKTGGVISGNLGVTGALNIGTTVAVTETNVNLLQLAGDYGAPVTIRNVATPAADNDAATKKYVDERAGESVLYVNITQSDSGRITGDKTYDEILAAVTAGKCVIAKLAGMSFCLDSVSNDKIAFQRLDIVEDDGEGRRSIQKTLIYVYNDGVWTGDVEFVAVDTAMSDTSRMPVQNKVVKAYIDGLTGDISGKQDKSTLEADVAAKGFTKNTGTYSKPAGGIPKSDLAAAVQTSLGKADTALQEHQSLAAYRTAAAQDTIDSGKVDKVTGKGLTSNDYTDAAKAKVDAIPANPKYTDTVYDDTALKERVATIEGKESAWDAKLNASELPTAINTALSQAKASGEFDGADGKDGAAGADGITPTIGGNGNWYIGSTDTGKPSRGAQGSAGAAGKDGKSAYQYAVEGGYTGTESEFAKKLASEALIVTITDNNGTLSADKTYIEIRDAYLAGIPVYALYDSVLPLIGATAGNLLFGIILCDETSVGTVVIEITSNNEVNDISASVETLPNPNAITFTGAVTGSYDGSAAMTVNIPSAVTDAHINSLIDTKLGVIENGSY